MKKKEVINWIIALVGPFLATTLYLLISRTAFQQGTSDDYIAVTISIFVGLYGVIRLPYALGIKAIAVVLYLVVAFWALFYYSLSLLCAVFNQCV